MSATTAMNMPHRHAAAAAAMPRRTQSTAYVAPHLRRSSSDENAGKAIAVAKKELHEPSLKPVAYALVPATIELIDPQCKGGKIVVPVSQLQQTKGLQDWAAAHAEHRPGRPLPAALQRDLSVCCLHHQGRCKAQHNCRQIHVDRAFIDKVRAAQANITVCCRGCGDCGALQTAQGKATFAALEAKGITKVTLTGPGTEGMPELTIDQLGFTSILASEVEQLGGFAPSVFAVPWNKVCRLHLNGQCKYGKDCKNFHICSKIGPHLLARAAANVNAHVDDDTAAKAAACAEVVERVVASAGTTPCSSPPPQPCSCTSTPPPLAARSTSQSLSLESSFADDEEVAGGATTDPPSPVHAAATLAGEKCSPVGDKDAAKPLGGFQQATPPPGLVERRHSSAPLALRAQYPTLDEGSLTLRDAALDDLVFDLPTLQSAMSDHTPGAPLPMAAAAATMASPKPSDLFALPSPIMATPNHASPASTVQGFLTPAMARNAAAVVLSTDTDGFWGPSPRAC